MVWTTKKLDRDREYIIIKHSLRGINYAIKGVKFRDGFGVVEKNSKLYYQLKAMKPTAITTEYPIEFISKLPFITRSRDIEMVFGKDIYYYFINKLNSIKKEEAQKKHIEENKCRYIRGTSELCKNPASDLSPSRYCNQHIVVDPKIEDFGIEIPERIFGNDNRKKFKQEVLKKLEKVKKELKVDNLADFVENVISEEAIIENNKDNSLNEEQNTEILEESV